MSVGFAAIWDVFQSTPPVKAATDDYIYGMDELKISIHAAREGGDGMELAAKSFLCLFQSTPPVKAATSEDRNMRFLCFISIHAAREGGD